MLEPLSKLSKGTLKFKAVMRTDQSSADTWCKQLYSNNIPAYSSGLKEEASGGQRKHTCTPLQSMLEFWNDASFGYILYTYVEVECKVGRPSLLIRLTRLRQTCFLADRYRTLMYGVGLGGPGGEPARNGPDSPALPQSRFS